MKCDSSVIHVVTKCWAMWLGVALAFCAGCSEPNTAEVEGTVLKQDGAPLVGAKVIAREKSTGEAVRGDTDANGHFQLKGEETGAEIPAGEYEVLVVEQGGGPSDSYRPPSISPKYQRASSAGLTFRVTPGEDRNVSWTLDPP